MKRFFAFSIVLAIIFTSLNAWAQTDKSQRASPPATVSETLANGTKLTINYSQPALKGRTIGKDVEPMQGKVWRAGANEATTFETSKNVKVQGKSLPAGKYSMFMLNNGNDWTVIFNKKSDIGGTDYEKNKSEDALQVSAKGSTASTSSERLTYTINKNGKVSLLWGNLVVDFNVQ